MKELLTQMAGEIALSKNPGNSMKKWREIFGVSQTELADYLKVTPSTISDYEGGRRQSPGIQVVARLCEALIEIDKQRGGRIIKQLKQEFGPAKEIFSAIEFAGPVNGKEFNEKIEGKVLANPSRLKETTIYGYTLIDSLRAIIEISVHEYLQIYGKTPERALIFQGVETGRSPMIAVKIGKFSTEMKPSIVVLHGIEKVDPVAIKIAETEKIPLLATTKPIEEIKKALKEFE